MNSRYLLIFFLVVLVGGLCVAVYTRMTEYEYIESACSNVESSIEKKKNIKKQLDSLGTKDIKDLFFSKSDYLEKYLRIEASRGGVLIESIKGQLTEKDYADVSLVITASPERAINFIKLIENGTKFIHVYSARFTVKENGVSVQLSIRAYII